MKNLLIDDLIPDHWEVEPGIGGTLHGNDFKKALIELIDERISLMRADLCGVKDHDWDNNYDYKRCNACGVVVGGW